MVTLSSDFGPYYPAAMRGVLVGRGIERVVDVTHELPRQDVHQSAFWLRELLAYFPPAVHCVVVDPGVGTDRDVSILRAGGHALVGPDNGVLWPVASRLASEDGIESYGFEHVDPASETFHGRDVFAPLAAAIGHLGIDRLEALPGLSVADEPTRLALSQAAIGKGHADVTILAVDGFGNAITDFEGSEVPFGPGSTVRIDGVATPVVRTYGAVDEGEALVTVGSHGHVELAQNQGRGTDAFDVDVGDTLRLEW
ncbi:MAG: SAM hydrolase/SAM-dependent halogenase family protein [Halobacteriota archaeon]